MVTGILAVRVAKRLIQRTGCGMSIGGRLDPGLLTSLKPSNEEDMTNEEYGAAYQRGYGLTVRFLVSRGLSHDMAQEDAQAAWAKGWERLGQLRDSRMVVTWMNSIALNIHRSCVRREPLFVPLPELSTPPKVNLASIDVRRMLETCKSKDREVLKRHYLEGYKVREIAQAHGWTETAVRIRLLRARRSLAKGLGWRVEVKAVAGQAQAASGD